MELSLTRGSKIFMKQQPFKPFAINLDLSAVLPEVDIYVTLQERPSKPFVVLYFLLLDEARKFTSCEGITTHGQGCHTENTYFQCELVRAEGYRGGMPYSGCIFKCQATMKLLVIVEYYRNPWPAKLVNIAVFPED